MGIEPTSEAWEASRDTGRTRDVRVLAGRASPLYAAATSAPIRAQTVSETFRFDLTCVT